MKRFALTLTAIALLVAWQGESRAGPLLYDNGPINGTINAWNVTSYEVTDSFVISNPATLGSARVGLWTSPGDVPTGTTWAIGTSPFGADISSGVSPMSSVFTGMLGFGFYTIYESTFAINGSVAPGTYWLSMTNTAANGGNGDQIYWDQNNGPSTAYQTTTGQLPGSQSFQIYGPNNVTPEPASLTLLAVGAVSAVGFAWRRRKVAA